MRRGDGVLKIIRVLDIPVCERRRLTGKSVSESPIPLYGTFLGGENLYEKTLSGNGILIMGNEGNGIRPAIEAFVNEKLYIPNYPEGRDTSESLNVAIATAVVCAEFRRRQGNPA